MRGYKEPDSGVIYIAFGEKYLEQAQYSAESLKKHTSIGITLLSDREVQSELFEEVKIIEPGHNRAKVDFLLQSPYDKTLYLDSDTLVLSDIGEIFSILERFDIVATHDLSRKRAEWTDLIPEYAEIPYGFPEINGGILGYRKTSAAKDLLNSWVEKFYEIRHITRNQDQPALRISLWESNARISVLPPEFNVRNEKIRKKITGRMKRPGNEDLMRPRILHFHGCHEASLLKKRLRRFRPMRTI